MEIILASKLILLSIPVIIIVISMIWLYIEL